MTYIEIALLCLVVICGITTCVSKNLMVSLIIFMAFSVIMSIIWGFVQAPDLAITEAAVGAGISSILLFLALRKIRELQRSFEHEEKVKASEDAARMLGQGQTPPAEASAADPEDELFAQEKDDSETDILDDEEEEKKAFRAEREAVKAAIRTADKAAEKTEDRTEDRTAGSTKKDGK